MSEARAAKQPPPPSEATSDEAAQAAYQRHVVAKIEAGLADSEAGRTIPHAEVVARMRARFAERRK